MLPCLSALLSAQCCCRIASPLLSPWATCAGGLRKEPPFSALVDAPETAGYCTLTVTHSAGVGRAKHLPVPPASPSPLSSALPGCTRHSPWTPNTTSASIRLQKHFPASATLVRHLADRSAEQEPNKEGFWSLPSVWVAGKCFHFLTFP